MITPTQHGFLERSGRHRTRATAPQRITCRLSASSTLPQSATARQQPGSPVLRSLGHLSTQTAPRLQQKLAWCHAPPASRHATVARPGTAAAAGEEPTGAMGPAAPAGQLPLSAEATRALRAAREQSVRQGLMFAGPDQLLLGLLAAGGSTATAALAAALELPDGDGAESVRHWMDEQVYGGTAPMAGGSGGLVASDVDLTAEAREVVRLAREGAADMGSPAVGTHHLLLVLLQAPGSSSSRPVPAAAPPPPAPAEAPASWVPGGAGPAAATADGTSDKASSTTSSNQSSGSKGGISRLVCSLGRLLRAAEADPAALHQKVLSLAETAPELPAAPAASYLDAVAHLRSTFQRQGGRPWHERDDAAFRMPPATGGAAAGAPDDEYE